EATRLVEALLDTRSTGSGDLEADEVAACYLGFLRLVFAHARDGSWDEALLESTISRLRQAMQTRLGNSERITTLLQLRIMSGNATGNSMDREEFSELLNSDYLLERSSNLWDSVALWAFEHNQMDVLEEAFENQTINPGSMMPQESWQRINLMFQLRRGVANRRDIEEYIKLMRMVPQIE